MKKINRAKRQILINGMKTLVDDQQMEIEEAAMKLVKILSCFKIDHDEDLVKVPKGEGERIKEFEAIDAFKTRGKDGNKVSYSRFVTSKKLGL